MNAPTEKSPHRRPDYLARRFPELSTAPLSTTDYFTPQWYELEKEHIFKKSWLRVARETDIPNPGDYAVRELECADTSVVVVRGQDGRIRAFHNVCSHRNNRVAYQPQGNTRAFVCRFHSWTYDTSGQLVNVPEREIFPDFEPCDHGLTAVACDTWEKFIFVNVSPEPAQTLREYIGEDIWNGYAGYLGGMTHFLSMSAILKANWKIVLDAFVESYHFSTVHAGTAGNIATSPANPNGYMDSPRFFGTHRVMSVLSNLDRTPTFCEQLARSAFGNLTLAPDVSRQNLLPPFVNPDRFRDWASDIMVLFPMCNIQPLMGWYASQNYWPIDHETTRWEFFLYMPAPQTAAQEVAVEYNRVYLRDVVREDVPNVEWVQSMLRSGGKRTQMLGDQEIMVRHAYKCVDDCVRGKMRPGA